MRRLISVSSVFFVLGCSATSGGGGGGVFIAADVKGCDAATPSGCIGFNTDTKGGETVSQDTVSVDDAGTTIAVSVPA